MKNTIKDKKVNDFIKSLTYECDLSWNCEMPQDAIQPVSIEIEEPSTSDTATEYLTSLIEDIDNKLHHLIEIMPALPETATDGVYCSKDNLISSIISVSRTIDNIVEDCDSVLNNNQTDSCY